MMKNNARCKYGLGKIKRKIILFINRVFVKFTKCLSLPKNVRIFSIYYKYYLKHKCKKIKKITKKNTIIFMFLTDAHWGANCKNSEKICSYISKQCSIDKLFFGGDFITHSDTDKDSMTALGKAFQTAFDIKSCAFYPVIGNHDNNSYEQSDPDAVFSLREISDLLKIKSGNDHVTYGGDVFYYVDCDKTRFICLNTSYSEHIDDQISFICNALKSCPSGYSIVIIGHIWLEWNASENKYKANSKIKELLYLFDSYNQRSVYNCFDFSKCEAKIVLLLGGHIHNDYTAATDGGIPIVLCDCDSMDKSYNVFRPVKGAPSEQCVTAIAIDSETGIIHCIRIGRGFDFKIFIN